MLYFYAVCQYINFYTSTIYSYSNINNNNKFFFCYFFIFHFVKNIFYSLFRFMQWQGNSYKAGLRERHCCFQVEGEYIGIEREYFLSSFTCKQHSNRLKYTRVGRKSPTLMGFKPIKSGDSYDVIRGGHRQFWIVRR